MWFIKGYFYLKSISILDLINISLCGVGSVLFMFEKLKFLSCSSLRWGETSSDTCGRPGSHPGCGIGHWPGPEQVSSPPHCRSLVARWESHQSATRPSLFLLDHLVWRRWRPFTVESRRGAVSKQTALQSDCVHMLLGKLLMLQLYHRKMGPTVISSAQRHCDCTKWST